MRIPQPRDGRVDHYREYIRRCGVTRDARRERYTRNRLARLTGSPDGALIRYNKLAEHIEFSSSYLYSSESVRWYASLPPHYNIGQWIEELIALKEELNRDWHDSGTGQTAKLCVSWGHVYDTVVTKTIISENEPVLYMEPDSANVGVSQEQLHEWDRQEAICHWYTIDLPTFRRMVSVLPVERRIQLLQLAAQHARRQQASDGESMPPTVQRILIAASSPNMIGVAQTAPNDDPARARSDEPVVNIAELWIRDDKLNDWRVATMLEPVHELLWDPPNPLVAGEHCFHPLCLEPTPGYIWGVAKIEGLLRLQEWRESKMADLDERMGREIEPPMFFKGFSNVDGEKAKLFRRRGGNISSSVPGAEVQPFPPEPLADPFGIIHEIDGEFARRGGLPKSMVGQAEPGTRSGEQTMAQAILGAGPTLDNAMIVEAWANGVATARLKLLRRTSGRTLRKASGEEFLLAQVPGDFVARVWGHTTSPLYVDRLIQKAMLAKQAGAIDNEDLLEYLDLPMTDRLIHKARHLGEQKAKEHDRLLKLKEDEVKAKMLRAVK